MAESSLPVAVARVIAKSLLAFGAVLSLSACPAPTETITSGTATMELAPAERIVVFPGLDCLSAGLAARADVPSRVIPTSDFQDSLFPWFEPDHAPTSPAALDQVLRKPHVRTRLFDLKVRYLIALTKKDKSGGFPGFICGGGYGGAGCLGLAWENNETSLDAIIWDLREDGRAGDLSARTSGTSLAIGVIVPIIFVAYTDADACHQMADLIAHGLSFKSHQ